MYVRPGGRLLPGEGDVEGLKRKLTKKLWERVQARRIRTVQASQLLGPPACATSLPSCAKHSHRGSKRDRTAGCVGSTTGPTDPPAQITRTSLDVAAHAFHRTRSPAKSSAAHKGQTPEWAVGELLATWWRPNFESASQVTQAPYTFTVV